jgi:hypothetical protein
MTTTFDTLEESSSSETGTVGAERLVKIRARALNCISRALCGAFAPKRNEGGRFAALRMVGSRLQAELEIDPN